MAYINDEDGAGWRPETQAPQPVTWSAPAIGETPLELAYATQQAIERQHGKFLDNVERVKDQLSPREAGESATTQGEPLTAKSCGAAKGPPNDPLALGVPWQLEPANAAQQRKTGGRQVMPRAPHQCPAAGCNYLAPAGGGPR
jgi:hypothetical protein